MTTTNKAGTESDSVGQRIEQASNRIGDIKDSVVNNLEKRVGSLGAMIEDHPFAAVGIGLGVGYLIARLLHR